MFERSWTVVNPANAGAAVVTLPDFTLPDGPRELILEAWTGSLQGANVFVFEDSVGLTDAQDRIAASGRVDALLLVPRGGVGRVGIPTDIQRRLTVFFDSTFASAQAVFLRIRER